MNKTKLSLAEEECDLGVIFTKDLKFSQYISKRNKANSVLALIKRTFEYIDKHTFLRLYNALVRPHLELANIVWYPYLRKRY